MRVLLDENISPAIGIALRALGYDVLMAADACPGAPDDEVVALAVAEARVLITEDKDFGELAFQQGVHPAGVIRLALPRQHPAEKAQRLTEALQAHAGLAQGNMLVVETARVRSRPLKP